MHACAQGYAEQGVRCWSGNDDEAHAARHEAGGQGVISVTSNLLPGLFSRLMRSPNQQLADSLAPLIAWLFCEPNPIGVNTAMVRLCSVRAQQPLHAVVMPPSMHHRGWGVPRAAGLLRGARRADWREGVHHARCHWKRMRWTVAP